MLGTQHPDQSPTALQKEVKEMDQQKLLDKGIPVIMKDGVITEYCDDIKDATSLILDLEDFPEIK